MQSIDWYQFGRWLLRHPAAATAGAIGGLLLAALALVVVPARYRATTLIFVEPSGVPEQYVKPTVTTNLQDRLDTLHQQIINRVNLERIVEELELYPHLVADGRMELAVAKAGDALSLEVHGNQVFRVSFEASSPALAADTANRIADLFIAQNLELRERLAASTTEFLEAELVATKRALEEQERRIAEFKQQHLGSLPEQRDTLIQSASSGQTKLGQNMTAIDRAETRRLALQREISELTRRAAVVDYVPAAPASNGRPAVAASASRVAQLEAGLQSLLGSYTEKHPDVIRLRREIEEARRQDHQAARAAGGESAPLVARPRLSAEDEVYLGTLRRDLSAVEIEIASLQRERQRIQVEIDLDRRSLHNLPAVESELLSLTRDYENLKLSYDSLVNKRIDAGLAENLERSQQREQFRVLERAIPPAFASWPNRPLFFGAGLMLGFLIGAAMTFTRFQASLAFHDLESLARFAPKVEILASLPTLDRRAAVAPPPARREASRGSSAAPPPARGPWSSVVARSHKSVRHAD